MPQHVCLLPRFLVSLKANHVTCHTWQVFILSEGSPNGHYHMLGANLSPLSFQGAVAFQELARHIYFLADSFQQ